jgi:hypothetical protein
MAGRAGTRLTALRDHRSMEQSNLAGLQNSGTWYWHKLTQYQQEVGR